VLMLQEPDGDHWHVDAEADAWPRLQALIRAGFRCRGGDFDAGRTLARRLGRRVTGLRQRTVAHDIPASDPYAALPLAFADSLAALWQAHGLVDDAALAALRRSLERALASAGARVRTFTLVQVWARKAAPAGAAG
jgi:hypothetical protein